MELSRFIARVREDLQDTDPANYRWSDEQIEAAIQRCVQEYSLQAAMEQQDDIPTRKGETELDISGLGGLLQVLSVEFPINQSPPRYQRFQRFAGHLYMEEPGDGSAARVRWLKRHTLSSQECTIPEEHEEVIVLGASGYLAESASVSTVDKATIGGRYTSQQFASWARERLRRYQSQLRRLSRGSLLGRGELYAGD